MKDAVDIQYQGRQTHRSGSEQRRQAILEGALRIIVKEGIRAVRHRAVAREADVPLSATTYYFKDIGDLIVDTFTFFAERAMAEVIDPFRELAFSLLVQYGSGLRESADKRAILLDQLSQITSDFILQEATEQRDHLVAEQAFFSEAIIDLRLAELATLYVEKQRVALSEACKLLGSSEPVLDGELLMAVIYRLERRVLTDTSLKKGAIRDQIRRTLELLVPPADS
jgi:DNA-binding transcriptional regulator YbjK